MNLTHDAMLVSLRISAWSGRRYDRQASDHVAIQHDASTTSGRYNKLLLPKAALKPLQATMSAARDTHYKQTLPWDDQGARLLPVANYEAYVAQLDGLRETMIQQRTEFLADYPMHVEKARETLGRLFNALDYPTTDILAGKFGLRYRIKPVPDADHFYARLAADHTEEIKRDIEADVQERLQDAIGELYERMLEALKRVSDRLQEDDEGKPLVFRNTLITNVRELVDVVPRLNIFGDDHLARLCEQVKERIAAVEPDTIRAGTDIFNPAKRQQVKRDADALMEQFAGYFGEREAA